MSRSPETFRRVEELFHRALELRADERRSFLDAACAGDPELRTQVELLLGEDARAAPGEFTRLPVGGLTPAGELMRDVVPDPERIGAYRIVGVCGHGGMGTVFEAIQDNPRRRVALKMVRPGLATGGVLRRFQEEAAILGRLDHPGICRIYEAGSADVGDGHQPFFAMEYIDGAPLLAHADGQHLDLRQRVMLFTLVCDAVHYAHQRGVIHRDLKPDNVLVVKDESGDDFMAPVGQPKVLDFGIARLEDASTRLTTQIRPGTLIGTLQYMSPEQAAGGGSSADARSDVFSLGVILYELLAGRAPHDLEGHSVPECMAILRDRDPVRLGLLRRDCRGDLETIAGKCLEKEPSRRYASAGELAADLRRFLHDEPIRARPPTTWDLCTRFARRHRALVVGTLATLLALSLGLGLSLRFAWRAARSEQAAADNESRALRQASRANLTAASALTSLDPAGALSHLLLVPEEARGWEWQHLTSALESERFRLTAADEPVEVLFSAEGEWLIAVSPHGQVEIWDSESGAAVKALPTGVVPRTVAWHPGTAAALSLGTEDGRVLDLDLQRGTMQEVLRLTPAEPVCAMAWEDRGRRLAIFTGTRIVRWQAGRLEECGGVALEHLRHTTHLAFSPDGTRLVALTQVPFDRRLWMWEGDDLEHTRMKAREQDEMISLAMSMDGRRLFLGTEQRSILEVDAITLRTLRRFSGHQRRVVDVAVGAGERLTSVAQDGTLRVWDTRSGRCVGTFPASSTDVAFHPSRPVVACVRVREIRLWEVERGPARVLHGHEGYVYYVTWSADGALLASSERFRQSCRLWDPLTGELLWRMDEQGDNDALALVEDGLVLAGSRFREDLLTDQRTACLPVDFLEAIQQGERRRRAAAYFDRSPDGSLLAFTGDHIYLSGPLILADPAGGFASREFPLSPRVEVARHPGPYWSVAFHPQGDLVAAGGERDIDLWDVQSGRLVARLEGHQSTVYSLDFSPDGTRLASGGNDNTVRLWDAARFEPLIELRGHDQYVMAVAFSPDGTRLASSSGDFSVRIWDTVPAHERSEQAREAVVLRERLRPRVRQVVTERGDLRAAATELLAGARPDAERVALRRLLLEEAARLRGPRVSDAPR